MKTYRIFAHIEEKCATLMKERKQIFKDTDTSILDLVERTLRDNWNAPAYTDYGTDINYTFGDVAKKIASLHQLYADLGIKTGDKIALCDKNSSNWAVSFLSVLTYGAVAVPILPDFNAEQIQNIFEHSEAKLMIGRADAQTVTPILDIVSWTMADGSHSINDYDNSDLTAGNLKYFRENADDLCLMSYTSGSTGRSKGVMLPYRSIWSNVKFGDEVLGLAPGERTMAILPMAHMYGFAFDFIYEFCAGCHVHFLTKTPSPAVVIKAFGDVKPSIVIAVPLIIEKIVTGKVFPTLRTPKMKAMLRLPFVKTLIYRKVRATLINAFGGNFYEVIIGGAAFSREVEDFLRLIDFPYTVGYGMTECGPIIGYEDWHRFAKHSCGKPAPRMEVKIDSADPENLAGEIITRGANVMLGYYKNPEETAAAIDADGWLHTGDLGTMDRDGNIFIRGRKKSMLLGANGQNVYPEEIEDVILSNTPFEETVVVQRGEKLVALVYISDQEMQKQGLTKQSLTDSLDQYKREVNALLPRFANLSAYEIQEEEFQKTPKRSIRRYLYK